ncbi:FliH/SctL family protein [Lentibacter algarum]|jgi:flagellar assembly protein FliH|uniref:FliH/SctL family protein n=1 Tax=Lentibacter algarum TaxID=576131 RepID=UPI0024933E4C|nr:FliH/SctL family protein [Lentibacter algarum]
MTQEFVPHEGLIRASDVAVGAPLKQSEITRFINTIDTEVYQRDEAAPRKLDAPFKPKNLLDLAREASERVALEDAARERAQKEAEDAGLKAAPEQPSELEARAPAAEEEASPADGQVAAIGSDKAEPQPLSGAGADAAAQDDGSVEAETAPATLQPDSFSHEAEQSAADPEPFSPNIAASENATEQAAESQITEAFEAGVLEGQRQARDEVEAMMSHALGLLEQSVQAFQEQGQDASSALRDSISASVISLASSRAGMQIDQMPQAFWARIETLAERIQTSTSAPILKVHPSDLLVLKPCLEQSSKLLSLRLVADESLARGDIDLALEGIRLTDVMPRVEQAPTFVHYVPLILADDVFDEPEAHTPELSLEALDEGQQVDRSDETIKDEPTEEGLDDITADEPEK